jgi:hypothetical protein
MRKLDDIPKKHPFNVPDDYFDQLPGKIQARVQGKERDVIQVWAPALRYALAMFVVAAVAFVWLWGGPDSSDAKSPETILASLETADLIAYLNEGEITTDELLEGVAFNSDDANEIEEAVFNLDLDGTDLNSLMDEID